MLDLQRVALLAGFGLFVFACGEKFTSVDPNAGGASGSSSAGKATATAGGAAGGDDATDGGADPGGSATAGGASAGRGGISSVAGSGGKVANGGSAGNGGSGGVVVEVPSVPLEGLELWFDANVGVTQVNGVVSVWKDRSPHKRDALQTAVNYRPKLGSSVLNGKAAVVFDGEDDYLKLPSLPGDFSHGVSIFTITQQDADDGSCTGVFEASNGSEIDDVHLGTWQGALLYEVFTEFLHATDQTLILGEPELLVAVHQTSQSVQVRRDSHGLGEDNFALPATIVRQGVFIGHTDYANCKNYNGSVGELLVYSRAVSDAELVEIETYLQKKWDCCAE